MDEKEKRKEERKRRRKEFIKKAKRKIKENIYNIPNFLTALRVVITFLIVYLVFAGFEIRYVVTAFIIGMLTDFFDGQIARRFDMKTEFGRKADMIADRLLLAGTVIALVVKFSSEGLIDKSHYLQIFLILAREILCLPFGIVLLTSGKDMPHANIWGKTTTALQGFIFPIILLSIFYPVFSFSIYLSILTGIVGAISAFTFISYVLKVEKENRA